MIENPPSVFSEAVAISAAEAAHPSPIADPRCMRCGYSLIGLEARRPCPECGLLVGFSLLDGRELRHNRPRWLRSLMLGAVLMAIGLVTFPAIGLAAAFFGVASATTWWNTGTDWFVWGMAWSIGLPPALMLGAGAWLLTRRAGPQRIDGTGARTRIWLRILAAAPLPMLAFCAAGSAGLLQGWEELAYSWCPWTLLIICMAALVAQLFWHLKSLAERAPAQLLAADSPVVGMVLAGSILAGQLIWLIGYFDTDASMFARGRIGDVMMAITAVVFGVGLAAAFWSIYLLVRYAVAFRKSARQARQLMRDFDASQNPAAIAYDSPP